MTRAGIWLSHRTASQRRQRNPRYKENQDEAKKAKVPCLIQSPASLHLYILSSSKKTCIASKSLNSESPLKIKKKKPEEEERDNRHNQAQRTGGDQANTKLWAYTENMEECALCKCYVPNANSEFSWEIFTIGKNISGPSNKKLKEASLELDK